MHLAEQLTYIPLWPTFRCILLCWFGSLQICLVTFLDYQRALKLHGPREPLHLPRSVSPLSSWWESKCLFIENALHDILLSSSGFSCIQPQSLVLYNGAMKSILEYGDYILAVCGVFGNCDKYGKLCWPDGTILICIICLYGFCMLKWQLFKDNNYCMLKWISNI